MPSNVKDKTIADVYQKIESIKTDRVREGGHVYSRYRKLFDEIYIQKDNLYSKLVELMLTVVDEADADDTTNIERLEKDIWEFYLKIISRRFGKEEILKNSNAVALDKQITEKDLLSGVYSDSVVYLFQYDDGEKSVNITDDLKVYFKDYSLDDEKVIALIPNDTVTQLDVAVLDTNRLSYLDDELLESLQGKPEREWELFKYSELSRVDDEGVPVYQRLRYPLNEDERILRAEADERIEEKKAELVGKVSDYVESELSKLEKDIYLVSHTIEVNKFK